MAAPSSRTSAPPVGLRRQARSPRADGTDKIRRRDSADRQPPLLCGDGARQPGVTDAYDFEQGAYAMRARRRW